MKKISLYFLMLIFIAVACEDDEPATPKIEAKGYSKGIFIVNEGSQNDASITYFLADSNKVVQDLFYKINNRQLGQFAQSFTKAGNKGFIVINGSNKLEIVDMETFTSQTTIENLSYPRYVLNIDDKKAYLTNGKENGVVYVIDVENNTISDTIKVGKTPENLIKSGDFVYVANSSGWENIIDSTVSIIDIKTDKVIKTLTVGDNPQDFAVDKNGDIWVLCAGNAFWHSTGETNSFLVQINGKTNTVKNKNSISKITGFGTRLTINKSEDKLYYKNGEDLFVTDIENGNYSTAKLPQKGVYGLDINPKTGNLILLTSPNFTSNGYMYRYSIDGENFNLIDSTQVGVAPNGAYFY